MKKIITTIVIIISTISVFAQKNKSTIRFSASDGLPIAVTLNDRDYNKSGRSITFKDIPRKRHNVRIYSIATDERMGRKIGTTLFSGSIKIEPGKTYDAILDVKNNTLRVNKVKSLTPFTSTKLNNVNIIKSSTGINTTPIDTSGDIEIPLDFNTNLSSELLGLKKDVDATDADTKKIAIIEQYIANKQLTAYESRAILSWLLFDDNKLSLSQQLKSKIKDKENLQMLGDAFSLEKNKTTYLKSL